MEAAQVLKHGAARPFDALGLPRLASANSLNAVTSRQVLKSYRRLALRLHPDRCDHPLAVEAMQKLNDAYERARGGTAPRGRGGAR